MLRRTLTMFMVFALLFVTLFTTNVAAADYSNGVDVSGTTATIWFKSVVNTTWVDVHYKINSGAQQNVRMTYNSATARYEKQVTVASGNAINYNFTYNNGTSAYDTSWFSYTVGSSGGTVATPTFTPAAGTYTVAQNVTIACGTSGATIRYTVDGTTPTTTSPVYSGAISVASTKTIKAFATATGKTNSAVASATYTMNFTIPVTGVSLNKSTTSMTVGTSETLVATIAPTNATNKNVTWSSSNTAVATVNSTGKVTGVKAGNATITVNTVSGGKTATCQVTVTAATTTGNTIGQFNASLVLSGTTLIVTLAPTVSTATANNLWYTNVANPTSLSQAIAGYSTGSKNSSGNYVITIPNASIGTNGLINLYLSTNTGDKGWVAFNVNGTTQETVATPAFSVAAGTYTSAQSVTLSSATTGATIRYTTNGSTPTATSTQYTAAISVSVSTSIKAIAMKSGMTNSTIASATYTISTSQEPPLKPGFVTLQTKNNTGGQYSDDQIYWAIVGQDPITKAFVHVDSNGNLVPMQIGDNNASNHLTKTTPDGTFNYSNYFYKVSQQSYAYIPKIIGARMYISYGETLYITVNQDINGKIGYGGPNLENTSDPNTGIIFEWAEFAWVDTGIWINTTRVDQFCYPYSIRLVGNSGYNRINGDIGTRAEIMSAFVSAVPTEFKSLAHSDRIYAPAQGLGSFRVGQPNANYYDSYVTEVYNYYKTHELTFTCDRGTYSGHVVGTDFVFKKGNGAYEYYIHGIPTTQEVLLGNGIFDGGNDDEKSIKAQICAAFNRHVMLDTVHWNNSSYFYKTAPANYYSEFFHQHAYENRTYGFCYDDVFDFSSTLQVTDPKYAIINLGW